MGISCHRFPFPIPAGGKGRIWNEREKKEATNLGNKIMEVPDVVSQDPVERHLCLVPSHSRGSHLHLRMDPACFHGSLSSVGSEGHKWNSQICCGSPGSREVSKVTLDPPGTMGGGIWVHPNTFHDSMRAGAGIRKHLNIGNAGKFIGEAPWAGLEFPAPTTAQQGTANGSRRGPGD